MTIAEKGNQVAVHYVGTFNDGKEFDSSLRRGDPIRFILGEGKVIPGFESAIFGMTVAETKQVTIPAAKAYGPINPLAVIEVEKHRFPDDFVFVEGGYVRSFSREGRPVFGRITEVKEETVILDVNHPLAGKDLNFNIQVISIDSVDEESKEEGEVTMANWNAKMKKGELLNIAKTQGLDVNTRSTKAQIIEALSAQGAR
tara:strand:- start:494 stop:1093 length:600 start_codon:yes stop_codon:yes gene_type:complete